MNTICLNPGEQIAALLIVIGLILLPSMAIEFISRQRRKRDLQRLQTEKNFTAYEREMLSKGYLFTTVWSMAMLKKIAMDNLGMQLTDNECIHITAMIKSDFTIDRGISKFTIVKACQAYAKRRLSSNK